MKIAYCIRNLKDGGGMARVLTNKANYLTEVMGEEVAIITVEEGGYEPFFKLSPKVKLYHLGINYINRENVSLFFNVFRTLKTMRKHRRKLELLLKSLRVDIVVSMFDVEARFLWKIKDGSRKILEVHFSREGRRIENKSISGRWMDYLKNYYDERIVGKYDAFIVLTNEDRENWKYASRIVVIPNAYAIGKVDVASLTVKRVIAVGKLTYQKGFEYLIDVWKKLTEEFPDWELVIVGEGEDRNMLVEKISSYHLKNVSLKPFTKAIGEEYRKSSVFAMTSRYEGLPMVLLEAMGYGLPCISFACPCGPSEVIREDFNGYLIPPGNIETFAVKLRKLMTDFELRKEMGKHAQKTVERFSEERVMEQWQKLFRQILGNSGKKS